MASFATELMWIGVVWTAASILFAPVLVVLMRATARANALQTIAARRDAWTEAAGR